jgi:hypothetical protein
MVFVGSWHPRPHRSRARRGDRADRADLERQRGLADRRGRRPLLRVPEGLCGRLQRPLLGLILVLWLLIGRGLGIEIRHQIDHPLWRIAWDTVFWLSSAALALVFGVALGKVVRGVPLGPDGYFHIERVIAGAPEDVRGGFRWLPMGVAGRGLSGPGHGSRRVATHDRDHLRT